MSWSDWSAIRSDGSIPEDLLPCDAWQARWFLEWDYDVIDTSSMGTSLTGEWHWQIDYGGDPVFFSKNKVRVSLIWFSYGFGGLGSAVWYWDGSGDRVLTTSPGWSERPLDSLGDPIWAGGEVAHSLPIWSASHPDADGTEQPYLDPASGTDFYQNTVYIQSWWQGAIYEIPLTQGAVWSVPFHNIGATWLIKLANLQMRTRRAGDIGGCFDAPGILRVGGIENRVAIQRILRHGCTKPEIRTILSGVTSPSLQKSRDNKLYCLCQRGSTWMFLGSCNDGITWEEPQTVWSDGYENAKFVILPNGGVLHLATSGGVLYSMRSESGSRVTVTSGVVPPLSVQYDSRQGAVVVDSVGSTWVSRDCGVSWERTV